jgi:hypothetical protein
MKGLESGVPGASAITPRPVYEARRRLLLAGAAGGLALVWPGFAKAAPAGGPLSAVPRGPFGTD